MFTTAAATTPRGALLGIGLLAASCTVGVPSLAPTHATLTADGRHTQCALRYGERDDASDSLPFPGEWTSTLSWCFRAGAPLTLGFALHDDPGGATRERRYTLDARLTRRDAPGRTVWSLAERDQPYARPARVVLPALPLGLGVYALALTLTTYGAGVNGEARSHTEARVLRCTACSRPPHATRGSARSTWPPPGRAALTHLARSRARSPARSTIAGPTAGGTRTRGTSGRVSGGSSASTCASSSRSHSPARPRSATSG